jgi:hypothetical protein
MSPQVRPTDAARYPPLARAPLDPVDDHVAAGRRREPGDDPGRRERCGKPARSRESRVRRDAAMAHICCRITRASPP